MRPHHPKDWSRKQRRSHHKRLARIARRVIKNMLPQAVYDVVSDLVREELKKYPMMFLNWEHKSTK